MKQKFLFVIGGSGCGKTTIAKNLEEANPEKYYRVIETTTREMRTLEKDGEDYIFVTKEDFYENYSDYFQTVEYQFLPNIYGARLCDTVENKWNILVVSIEGLLSALKNLRNINYKILNIISDKPFIEREGRSAKAEENLNHAVLDNLIGPYIPANNYIRINVEDLASKSIYEKETIISELIESKMTLREKIHSVSSFDELVKIFMKHSNEFEVSSDICFVLNDVAEKFGKSLAEVCQEATNILLCKEAETLQSTQTF